MYITTTEAACKYDVSLHVILWACRSGKIPHKYDDGWRVRKAILMDESDVETWYRRWSCHLTRPIRKAPRSRSRCMHVGKVSWRERDDHLDSMSAPASDVDSILAEYERPTTRGACEDAPRPCPWVGCRYHLFACVRKNDGRLMLESALRVEDMVETCALDVADRGGRTLEQVGLYLHITRERVRQIEAAAVEKIRSALEGPEERL